MIRTKTALLALVCVAACDGGNPLVTSNTGTTSTSTRELLPGTANPSRGRSIVRYEAQDATTGNGFASEPTYDATTDSFVVDNLPFDGDNIYARDDVVGTLNGFNVYENDSLAFDPITGNPIPQFQHKAIYAESASGRTELAIVRTGAYGDYGFGGFVYERNGGVTLPKSGQAIYTGQYASLRDFDGAAGLEYGVGTATIQIDFDDFNGTAGVTGTISNRAILDQNGNDITASFLAAMSTTYGTSFSALPILVFNVHTDALDENGEILGTLQSTILTSSGLEVFESGTYYAILAGNSATEVAGILVVTSEDPRGTGIETRETGGFIATR